MNTILKIIFAFLVVLFLSYWTVQAWKAIISGIRDYRTRKKATQTLLEHMNELVKLCDDKEKRDDYLSFCLALTCLCPSSILAPIAGEVEEEPTTPITGAKAFLRLKSDMGKGPEAGRWYFKLQPSGQKALLEVQALAYTLIQNG